MLFSSWKNLNSQSEWFLLCNIDLNIKLFYIIESMASTLNYKIT